MTQLKKCQYARCSNPAIYAFPDETEATYCSDHKAPGMVNRLEQPAAHASSEPSNEDYYAVLNVTKTATTAEIKRAYHRESLKYHPDKNPSPEASHKFVAISEAYATLSDPGKREVYDRLGAEAVRRAEQTQGATDFPAPKGFTVVAARELFASNFGEGNADHFFEFEFLKENSVTGVQEPAKCPVHVRTTKKGNQTITRTEMIHSRPNEKPKQYIHEKIVTVNQDGTETVEEKEEVKDFEPGCAMCCFMCVGCLYVLTCGCGCNFCFNCFCNGFCGICPWLITYLKAAKQKGQDPIGAPPTSNNMDR